MGLLHAHRKKQARVPVLRVFNSLNKVLNKCGNVVVKCQTVIVNHYFNITVGFECARFGMRDIARWSF